MGTVKGPYRDPGDDSPPRRHKEPKQLRHLRQTLTEAMAIEAFTRVFKRSPQSNDELAAFVEEYTLEMYNNGFDEWPELRRKSASGQSGTAT
jgi:hypothetical protein